MFYRPNDEYFCDGAFWDNNQTWYTENPDFTNCFQKTVLLWIPCAYLIVFSPFRVYKLSKCHKTPLNFSRLNGIKSALAGWIAFLAVLEIGRSVYFLGTGVIVPIVDFVSPLILSLTMVTCIVLLQYERRKGVYTSGFLLIFWLLLSVAGVMLFQSKVRTAIRMAALGDGYAVSSTNCECPLGKFVCHHVVAALLYGYKCVSKTDVKCGWLKNPKTAIKTDVKTMEELFPPSQPDYHALRWPFDDNDRSFFQQELAKLGRFIAMEWILQPEPCEPGPPAPIIEDLLSSAEFVHSDMPMVWLRRALILSEEVITNTALATKGQRNNPMWSIIRKNRITASNFGAVLRTKRRQDLAARVWRFRCISRWFVLHPPTCDVNFQTPEAQDAVPDIVEVKCPYSAAHLTIYEAVHSLRIFTLGIDDLMAFTTFSLCFPAVLLGFILSALVDGRQIEDYNHDKHRSPEMMSSILSRLTFWWFTRMVIKGFKQSLVLDDLWYLNQKDSCAAVVPHLEKHWKKELERRKSKQRKVHISELPLKAEVIEMEASEGDKGEVIIESYNHTKTPGRLFRAMVSAYLPSVLFTALLKLIYDVMQFISPLLLKLLIQFIEDKTEYSWRGMFYSVLMFILAMIQSLILHQYFQGCQLLGMRIRTSVTCLIYRKMLILSNTAKRLSTVGEIVNLMSVDAQRFMDLMTYVHTVWSGPLQIIVALYFLYMELGPSIFAGFGVMIVLIPINALIAKKTRDLQVKQMNLKDKRIKMMNEVLNGIKVLKLYAWEPSFEEQILDIRKKELKVLRTMAFLNAFVSFTWTTAPFLVSLVTFAVFLLSNTRNILDAEKAFVSLSLFNILRFPMSMLPQVISNIVQLLWRTGRETVFGPRNTKDLNDLKLKTSVSLNRLQKFLNSWELDEGAVIKEENGKYAVMIENGTFSWEKSCESSITLKRINICIPEGSLAAVVGPVGSGKSSFLSALLGEMEKIHGKVAVKGSLAYVPQQAWIQNLTLRENILFGKNFSEQEYSKVLQSCALQSDLEVLPAGDLTEIGEKGINLSGGQKQRVSLARAVYQNADVYLLDDPLSAVDANVGKHIFEKVVGPNGILNHKTRILVTHGLTCLPQVDVIIVLKEGEIVEVGSFEELIGHAGSFAEYMKTYLSEKLQNDKIGTLKDDKLSEDMVSIFGSVLNEEERTLLERQLSESVDKSVHTGEVLTVPEFKNSNSDDSQCLPELEDIQKTSYIVGHETDKLVEKITQPEQGLKLILDEKVEHGMVKFAVFWTYLKSVGVVLSMMTVILFVFFNGISIYSHIWLSEWSSDLPIYRNGTNGTIFKEVDIPQRNMRLLVYGALGLLQGIFTIFASLALYVGNIYAGRALHDHLVNNILASPMMFFDTTPTGRILNRFSKDVDVLDTQIGRIYESWLSCLLRVISVPIVIGYSTPYFLIAFLPLAIIYIAVQRFYVATSRQLKRLESTLRSPIYSHFGESINGVATIRAFGQQNVFIQSSENKVDENNRCYYPSIVANRWLAVRLEFVGNSVVFFACLFAVFGRATLTGGTVGLSVTYALNVTQTLNWLVRMTTELETNIIAVERVKEYSEIPREAPLIIAETTPEKTWPQKGEIVFSNYCVRYRNGLDLVLKDITCRIQPSEKIGIVGRTGAGKSSLLLGLFRIIESASGNIYIDGVDISKLGLHHLRSKLTIIPQEPVLFSGTLRMNLDPFDVHLDTTIWRALEHAHLKSFVESLPKKLYHNCTEGGENLSVGQRQLICLARALLRKTQILILDEATAAVDMETDKLIQETIWQEFESCTILTIAHRLNTVLNSNRVMVLDAGRIIEFDSPSKLLSNADSVFFKMACDANLV